MAEKGLLHPTTIEKNEHNEVTHAKRVIDINDAPDTQFDYVSRTDDNPIYVGVGDGVITTSQTGWKIYKFTWVDSPTTRITRAQWVIGIWDNRTTLF